MYWTQVLDRKDLIGGDFELNDNQSILRGQLSTIELQYKRIHFTLAWVAHQTKGGWVYYPRTETGYSVHSKSSIPVDLGEGRVGFTIPFIGTVTLFPKGNHQIHPKEVIDLPKPYERLLARFPEFSGPLSQEVVEHLLDQSIFSKQAKVYAKLPKGSSLHDLLSKFPKDHHRVMFLLGYIEFYRDPDKIKNLVY